MFRFRRSRFSKIGLSRDLDNEIGCQRLPEETNVGAVKHSALPMLHLRPDTAGPKWESPDTPWLKLPNTYVDLPEGYSQRTQMGVDVCLSNNGPRIPLVQDFSSSRGVEWTPLVLPGTRLLRKGVVITLCPARAAVTFRRV